MIMKKKTTKPNPLKFFNDNKAMAYKKAGGEMKKFKKSLVKAQNGIAGPQNNYWFNSPEKRAMYDAETRLTATGERSSNYSEEAQRDYENVIKNYQPYGPIVPLEDQVAELNKKYPYYNNIIETPFKGGPMNKGWNAAYKSADKSTGYSRTSAMKDKYPNVGTGLVRKKGGAVKRKKK